MVINNVYSLLTKIILLQDFHILLLFEFTSSILSDVTNHVMVMGSKGGFKFQSTKNVIAPVLRDSIHCI